MSAKLELQAIAEQLQRESWVPLKGVENVLTRGPLLIGLGVTRYEAEHYSGRQLTTPVHEDGEACDECEGSGQAWDGPCKGKHPRRGICFNGRVRRVVDVPDGDPLPHFHATPRGYSFHVERDGQVVTAGRIARGFDWRTPQHPGRSDHAAFTKSMRAVTRAIERASLVVDKGSPIWHS